MLVGMLCAELARWRTLARAPALRTSRLAHAIPRVGHTTSSAGMWNRWGCIATLLVAAAGLAPGAAGQGNGDLCFNQLQVLGSHNSYHQAPPQELLQAFGSLSAGPLLAWQYTHPSITAQLQAGVRALELDVNWDPQGGVFGQAAGLKIVGQNGWLGDPRYRRPGFKVLHIPDFDFRSSCVLLTECLAEIKAWSDANPRHLPIIVYLELKGADQLEGGLGGLLLQLLQGLLDKATAPGPTSFVKMLDATPQTFRDLQAELLSVFGSSSGQLLTPDGVRAALGAAPGTDLQQLLVQPAGASACPWPPLESMRGKVLPVVMLRGGGSQAAAMAAAYPGLAGSVAWVEQGGGPALPNAVFRSTAIWSLSDSDFSFDLPANVTDVVAQLAQLVRDATAAGQIVRARADADTLEARADFVGRRDAVIAAKAQVVASDFVLPANQQRAAGGTAPLYSTSYNVTLPGAQVGRCLRDVGGTAAIPVQQMSLSQGDAVYCGPLESAPPGRLVFSPTVEGAAAAAGPPPMAAGSGGGSGGGGGAGGGAGAPPTAPPPPPPPPPSSAGSRAPAAFLLSAVVAAALAL